MTTQGGGRSPGRIPPDRCSPAGARGDNLFERINTHRRVAFDDLERYRLEHEYANRRSNPHLVDYFLINHSDRQYGLDSAVELNSTVEESQCLLDNIGAKQRESFVFSIRN